MKIGRNPTKGKIVFQPSIFRSYVRECNSLFALREHVVWRKVSPTPLKSLENHSILWVKRTDLNLFFVFGFLGSFSISRFFLYFGTQALWWNHHGQKHGQFSFETSKSSQEPREPRGWDNNKTRWLVAFYLPAGSLRIDTNRDSRTTRNRTGKEPFRKRPA